MGKLEEWRLCEPCQEPLKDLPVLYHQTCWIALSCMVVAVRQLALRIRGTADDQPGEDADADAAGMGEHRPDSKTALEQEQRQDEGCNACSDVQIVVEPAAAAADNVVDPSVAAAYFVVAADPSVAAAYVVVVVAAADPSVDATYFVVVAAADLSVAASYVAVVVADPSVAASYVVVVVAADPSVAASYVGVADPTVERIRIPTPGLAES